MICSPDATGVCWLTVRDGKNLPAKGQEILFVDDVRGTQDGFWREFTNRQHTEDKYFDINIGGGNTVRLDYEGQMPLVRVKHGWVNDVGFSEETKEWWIEVRPTSNWLRMTNGYADHVTHWTPMPSAPQEHRADHYSAQPYPCTEHQLEAA